MLEQVCKALGDLTASSKWNFFTTPKISLEGKTPLKALANGDFTRVMVAVTGFVEE